MRSKLLVLLAVFALVNLVGGAPSPAAAAQDATILSATLNGCFIDVTFQVEDARNYYVNVWDDGNFRAGAGGAVPANGIVTVRYVIGDPILEGASGIGLYVENGIGVAATTTYDSIGNFAVPAAVGDACAAANDTSAYVLVSPGCDAFLNIPATAVVGAFVADAPVYSEPGVLTEPVITIPAGKTYWVLGLDTTGQYYKIYLQCQAVWVPASTMGPNYDDVWQGKPLPTGIVE